MERAYASPMARYDLLAFDLYGTLLDLAPLAGRLRALGAADPEKLLKDWRKAQLERTWHLNEIGKYEPFDAVTANALAQVAPEIDAKTRARMADEWLTLPAHADAPAAFKAMAAAKVRCTILSNGTAKMIRAALTAAKLDMEVRSVDEVKVYKPDPRVYALLDSMAPRERTLFVSSNPFDSDGCKRTGRIVAFVDRHGQAPTIAPDLRVNSLTELVKAVLG
jgi:2-haloacid dehalogenase